MEKETKELFLKVFNLLSDYGGDNKKAIEWAINIYCNFFGKRSRSFITIGDTLKGREFICAIAFSFIVTIFTKRISEDYFSEVSSDKTINFDRLGLSYKDIECYLEDLTKKRKKEIAESGVISLEDIWIALWDCVKDTYTGLVVYYKEQGSINPDRDIYNSLISIFDTIDDETGEVVTVSLSFSKQTNAYSFVSEGFRY